MDLYAIAGAYSLRRVTSLAHAQLPASAVLCAKLLATSWLLTGQVAYLRANGVAFGGAAGAFTHAPAWTALMLLVQLLAILTILCSPFLRTGCGVLASVIALLAALDQPLFSNNRAFCAALFAMLALAHDASLVLLRAQAALVYGCAALDKWLAPDWRGGAFLSSFAQDLCRTGELWSPGWSPGARLPLTCALSGWLQAMPGIAVLLSAALIACELAIACGYALRLRFTAPLAIAFHAALFVLTGSTFGVFFHAGVACSVALIELERLPRPFDRALPYLAICAWFCAPWVRPWHAVVLAAWVSALALWRVGQERPNVTEQRA